jgi:hypothetical protein
MASIFQRPAAIAVIIAMLSIVGLSTILVLDHRRSQSSPPGTSFNTVNDAGAQMAPSQPASPIEPPRVVPAPLSK